MVDVLGDKYPPTLKKTDCGTKYIIPSGYIGKTNIWSLVTKVTKRGVGYDNR